MFGPGVELYLALMNITVRKGAYSEVLRPLHFGEICVSQWRILKPVGDVNLHKSEWMNRPVAVSVGSLTELDQKVFYHFMHLLRDAYIILTVYPAFIICIKTWRVCIV